MPIKCRLMVKSMDMLPGRLYIVNKMKKIVLAAALWALVFFPAEADWADFYSWFSSQADGIADPNTGLTAFPTLTVPIGGLYEGMGTAHTAVALDSSFIESNPAGSSLLEYTELTLYHNNWIADTSIEGVVYSVRYGNLGMGVAGKFLHVPFTGYNQWGDRSSGGQYAEIIATLNVAYNFFSSYDFYGLAVGANLKGAYRHVPLSIPRSVGVEDDQSALAGMVDIGFLTKFNFLKFYTARERNFSIGGVVKNLGPPVGPEDNPDPLPSMGKLGLGYKPIRPLLITLDYTVPFAIGLPPDHWENHHIAVGSRVAVTDFFTVHNGFSYRGGNPRFTVGSSLQFETLSFLLNYTLDLTTQVNRIDRFSIEAKLNLGDRGRKETAKRVDSLYAEGLDAYAAGDLNRAIAIWKAALEIDPTFTPAERNIALAERSLELQETMRSLYQVE